MSILHFGISIKEKPSNHINKEYYLSSKPEGMHGWSEDHYPRQRLMAELNYDLNMKYFDSLSYDNFNQYISAICEKHKFIECTDLKVLNGVSGVYMLVLDNFKQLYVGQSTDIKARIQRHWNGRKSLERLIFGDVLNSVISVDCFGALDTTRIFYIPLKPSSLLHVEEKIEKSLDHRYCLNRTAGGIGDDETNQGMVALSIIANQRHKNLLPFLDDANRLKAVLSKESWRWYVRKYPEIKDKLS